MKKSIAVVGGGIVGILSAIYLKKNNYDVILIDRGELGGLLNSYKENEVSYDFGTHIPMSTGHELIDGILFNKLSSEDWEIFNDLKVSNYFEGSLNLNSVYPDLKLLDQHTFFKGFYELLQSSLLHQEYYKSLDEYYEIKFGTTIKENVYRQIYLKLTGTNLEDLHYKNSLLFDVNRVIVAPESFTNQLKENLHFDKVIASNNYNTTDSGKLMYYPKNNKGVGLWISELEKSLNEHNIKVETKKVITKIGNEDGKIKYLDLDDGQRIEIDQLIWTVPIDLLVSYFNNHNSKKKKFRNSVLLNYELNIDFLIDKHFVTCWDKNLKTFRVTLYPNLTSTLKSKKIFNCTVEVFVDEGYAFSDVLYEDIFNELILMGIVAKDAIILNKSHKLLRNAFPILTKESYAESEKMIADIKTNFSNVLLCGRANISTFFMKDSLMDAIEKLDKFIEGGKRF